MKKLVLACFMAFSLVNAFAQLNMTLLDQIDYTQDLNDIWGWVDPDDGTEYALVGTVTGVSVVSLADPSNAVEVEFLPGANSTWRDIKTWGNFAYCINETANGLMVIDLTGAPSNITATDWVPNIPGIGTYNTAHNIWIDEFGYAYIAGANVNEGGMLIVDVFTTPGSPQFVAAAPAVYSHDVYTRANLMYASEIYEGNMTIYDVSDKQNIVTLGQQQTPFSFTHNTWLSDNSNVAFTTDERANAPIGAYDVSDPANIVELDQFRPILTLGEDVIPHNVHVWQDWLVISYYTDGGVIADASRPENIIEVGNWDSFLGANGGFSGAWGAYPFLPSGLVLLTDIGNGLFVCGANYVRACWLEGTVTNAVTGAVVAGANAHIESTQANTAASGLNGVYKTGQAISGTFDVTFSATGYETKVVPATLENGVLTILDVQLNPLQSYSFAGQTVKSADGTPLAGATIFMDGEDSDFTATSDANGNFNFTGVFGGTYDLYAGAWGYQTELVSNIQIGSGSGSVVVELQRGYYDDFILDFGWTTANTSPTGLWTRAEPVGVDFQGNFSNTDLDITGDLGDKCFLTGNGGGAAGDDDVDNGSVTLTSPVLDLSNYIEPVLTYTPWFFNGGGSGNPNDNFTVKISNGSQTVTLETISQSASAWKPESSFDLASLIPLTNNMRVIFEATDANPGHLVEAAVDGFRVVETAAYPVFSASATDGCTPFTVQFTDNSDSTATWNWSFPGGTPATSTQQSPSVVYSQAGSYNVTLNLTTSLGNNYTIEQTNFISVLASPSANFSFSLIGNVANFTSAPNTGSSFAWNFGDGVSSSVANPSHTFSEPGTYEVTLTVVNNCGEATLTQTVTVEPNSTNFLDENAYRLAASPNPFQGETVVKYELGDQSDRAKLLVFNVFGQQVAELAVQGKTGSVVLGEQLNGSGVFFLQLNVEGKMGKAVRVVRI